MFPKRMFNPVFCDYAFESAFLSFVILMNFCIQCQYIVLYHPNPR